jgi:hypothetical protein
MLIKEDNAPCISFTEASVDLQHGEIICLTDASVKWLQRRMEDYRSGKSDMYETVKDFINTKKFGQGFASADSLVEYMLVMEAFQGLYLSMLICKLIRTTCIELSARCLA